MWSAGNLDIGVVVVRGIYSPQPPHSRWEGCLSKGARYSPVCHQTLSGAPATVRCASHVTQPLGFGRCRPLEPLSSSGTGQSSAAPDRHCSLSDAPLMGGSALPHIVADCSSETLVFAVDRCAKKPLLRWCTGQSGGTPDSPVNYSGAALEKPETSELEFVRPWHTGHCPVAHQTVRCARPEHSQGSCSFEFEPFVLSFIGLCWTFMHM
jgi:hypothetical protein